MIGVRTVSATPNRTSTEAIAIPATNAMGERSKMPPQVETAVARDGAADRLHGGACRYLTSVSSLNIGRYIEMTIVPTIAPTPIMRIGSMIEVSDWMLASTSSS